MDAQETPLATVKSSPEAQSQTHFFAFFLLSLFSASSLAAILACCCILLSSGVIRGTMSSKGFSTMRIPMILGGLKVEVEEKMSSVQ